MAKILLIEDDEDLRFLLADFLSQVGHAVIEASDGREAFDRLDDVHPDLVVTDMIMEGMEGIETVMNMNREHGDTPVLAISGNSLYLENSMKLGAAAALLKPFKKQEFLEQVNALLMPKTAAS